MNTALLAEVTYIMFLVFLGYFIAVTSFYLALTLIGLIEGSTRARQSEEENYPLLFLSTVTRPVSIILPAHNEEDWIEDTVLSLLALNYPKFEVIIVNDGSTDRTLEILKRMLDLKALDIPYIKHYKDGKVVEILKSEKYPNVTVIDKIGGLKKAGAMNAGLNIAQYDYICTMDADTILEPDALIKVMAHVERAPAEIIGIGSHFGLVNGLKIKNGKIMNGTPSYNPIVAYQNLEYMRSFIGNRIAWSRYNAMPNVAGGFGIWRKDILYELGGYSSEFTCEDIELTFRVHDYMAKDRKKGYKIVMLPYTIGWTEGPSNVGSLISQRERWQRVTNETIWHYKYMFCNPKYGGFAFLVLPYFLLYEVLGVFFEVFSIAMVTFGWIAGMLDVKAFLAFMALMVLAQAFSSLLTIFSFVKAQRTFKLKYIIYLIILSFSEFLFYRWIISFSKLVGTLRYFLRIRAYSGYIRAKRA